MPIYEYACKQCEHEFEALVQGDEEAECPECHSSRLQKRFSVPAAPRANAADLPMSCDSSLPPCGPGCCRL